MRPIAVYQTCVAPAEPRLVGGLCVVCGDPAVLVGCYRWQRQLLQEQVLRGAWRYGGA